MPPPWTAAHQASPSFTISQSLLKLMSIESVMPSNHLILCRPFLLLPSVFPNKLHPVPHHSYSWPGTALALAVSSSRCPNPVPPQTHPPRPYPCPCGPLTTISRRPPPPAPGGCLQIPTAPCCRIPACPFVATLRALLGPSPISASFPPWVLQAPSPSPSVSPCSALLHTPHPPGLLPLGGHPRTSSNPRCALHPLAGLTLAPG